MRLSGGQRSGHRVVAPKGTRTRPTSSKVREALFAMLGKRIEGARVLDLFAGSGALGFEAMSRGAGSVVFIDNDANAVMSIRRNAVRLLDDPNRWRIMPMHASRALRMLRGTFDVVLADPPYTRGATEELTLMMQRGLLAERGIVVWEHPSAAGVQLPASMRVVKEAKYGNTALTFAVMRTDGRAVPDEQVQQAAGVRSRARISTRRRTVRS
jgi:16S rRNA (guanine966-N2)-methyltransferase